MLPLLHCGYPQFHTGTQQFFLWYSLGCRRDWCLWVCHWTKFPGLSICSLSLLFHSDQICQVRFPNLISMLDRVRTGVFDVSQKDWSKSLARAISTTLEYWQLKNRWHLVSFPLLQTRCGLDLNPPTSSFCECVVIHPFNYPQQFGRYVGPNSLCNMVLVTPFSNSFGDSPSFYCDFRPPQDSVVCPARKVIHRMELRVGLDFGLHIHKRFTPDDPIFDPLNRNGIRFSPEFRGLLDIGSPSDN